MATLLSVFVAGVSYGLILFLLASGLSLIMGLMRIVNMAHGALYMVGAYVGATVAKHTNFWVGVMAGAVFVGLIGLLMEVVFLRRLFKQELSQVLLTIGLVYVIVNVTQWIWGTYPLATVVPPLLSGSVTVGSIDLPVFRLFLIALGLVMALLLWFLQDKTRVGAMVRGGMDDREMAGALGVRLSALFTWVFVFGCFIVGFCGLFGGFLTGINLGLAWEVLLLSLVVVVVGGTGSIQGALLGGLLIGLLNAFGVAYFPQASAYIIYGALIVILLVKPSGLLGRAMQGVGDRATEYIDRARAQKSERDPRSTGSVGGPSDSRARLLRGVPYLAVLLVLLVLPPFTGTHFQGIMAKMLIFAVFAMSLDLTMGYTGLASFGHAAFFGVAGYSVAILTLQLNITSFWLVLLATLVITVLFAVVIGYLSLRVSGVYYILVTMALAQMLMIVATKWYGLTGGRDGLVGIPDVDLGFVSIGSNQLGFYYFVFAAFVATFVLLRLIVRSAFGRTLEGIRQNEPRMKSLGFNTWAAKYSAILTGALFAGLGGMLLTYLYGAIEPSSLSLEMSALPMLMVILGGAGTIYGPCLGAAVIVLIQYFASSYLPERWPLILGASFVLCVVFVRGGIAPHLSRLWNTVVCLFGKKAVKGEG